MFDSKSCLRAFTLVEVLIVVIILGILAAVVVPQFSAASQEDGLHKLQRNLELVRQGIERYKAEHEGRYPTLVKFAAQLTLGSDPAGQAGSDFGPYLLAIPENPFTGNSTVTNEAPGPGKGWYYDEITGEFRANDSEAHRSL